MVPINKCEKQGHQTAVLEKIIVTNYEKIAQLFIWHKTKISFSNFFFKLRQRGIDKAILICSFNMVTTQKVQNVSTCCYNLGGFYSFLGFLFVLS